MPELDRLRREYFAARDRWAAALKEEAKELGVIVPELSAGEKLGRPAKKGTGRRGRPPGSKNKPKVANVAKKRGRPKKNAAHHTKAALAAE